MNNQFIHSIIKNSIYINQTVCILKYLYYKQKKISVYTILVRMLTACRGPLSKPILESRRPTSTSWRNSARRPGCARHSACLCTYVLAPIHLRFTARIQQFNGCARSLRHGNAICPPPISVQSRAARDRSLHQLMIIIIGRAIPLTPLSAAAASRRLYCGWFGAGPAGGLSHSSPVARPPRLSLPRRVAVSCSSRSAD